MTRARRELVDIDLTPYYHCTVRCVRRAFLFGDDPLTGKNYDHRKVWIVERLKFLDAFFAIDVCAYAVMSNHLHLVLRVEPERAAGWSDEEVLRRAAEVFPTIVAGQADWDSERRAQMVELLRERLSSLSWFMSRLNEYIARRANQEDGCKGRFWESRFDSRALLDEGALLRAMTYVDLNPVRAGIAEGLDDSSWTSIQQRLREAGEALAARDGESPEGSGVVEGGREAAEGAEAAPRPEQLPELAPMEGDGAGGCEREPLPMSLLAYVALLEWTGRALRDGKRGVLSGPPAALVSALGLDPERWLESVEMFGSLGGFSGHPSRLQARAEQLGRRRLRGQSLESQVYALAA